MKKLVSALVAAGALFALSAGAAFAASAVSNGSFENGTDPGSFTTIANGDSTSITDWTVSSGDVDYIGTYWAASDGARSIDLDGDQQGAISQTFPTVSGTPYAVTFDLSGNPDGAPTVKTVQVSATGGAPAAFTFDTSVGNTHSNMMWQHKTYNFTATSNSTTLTFASQDPGDFGAVIDNVAVTPTAPVCTATADGTAAVVATNGQTITGTIDATGCDIGVFVGSGVSNVTVTATIHDANKDGVLADGATNVTVTGSTVYNIGNHTGVTFDPNGVQSGQGIRFQGSSTGSVSNNTVYAYEKNGIAITHGSNANVTGNQVTGLGSVNFIAANGIELFDGATGSITGNTVSNNYCTVSNVGDDCTLDPTSNNPAVDGSTGILVYGPTAASVTVSNNTLTGNQYGIWVVATPAVSIDGNTISGTGASVDTGVTIWSADEYTSGLGFTETGTTGSITHNTISSVAHGVLLKNFSGTAGMDPLVSVNNNSLLGSSDGMWTNVADHTVDGACNWWGAANGPGPEALGSGSGVTGNIDFETWLSTSNLSNTCSQPPVAMCPSPFIPSASPIDTITVNSNMSTPTSGSTTLASGQPYLLKSTGTWTNSNLNVADTAFASVDNWTTHMQGYDIAPFFLGPQEFQLQVNGAFASWGPYDGATHTYYDAVTGSGSPVSLMVFDGQSGVPNPGWYGDNNGSLTVNVYSCVVPPPPANACATPNSAPAGYTLRKGTSGNDSVTLAPNTMYVDMSGNNKVTGPDGNYIVCTGQGNDTITLGNGDDTISDTGGNNTVKVGNGSENITTGAGNDTIVTGNGGTSVIDGGNGNNTVKTGTGSYTITTGSGNDTITTQSTGNTINAGGGHNTVHQI